MSWAVVHSVVHPVVHEVFHFSLGSNRGLWAVFGEKNDLFVHEVNHFLSGFLGVIRDQVE